MPKNKKFEVEKNYTSILLAYKNHMMFYYDYQYTVHNHLKL